MSNPQQISAGKVVIGMSAPLQVPFNKEGLVWRIDKEETTAGHAMVKDNLIQFMMSQRPRDISLRGLLLGKRTPQFAPVHKQQQMGELNREQSDAIAWHCTTHDVLVLHGSPKDVDCTPSPLETLFISMATSRMELP